MKETYMNVIRMSFWTLSCWAFLTSAVFGADATLVSAKKAAESKGYIFETSHDEIVAKAKKEGKLRVLVALDPRAIKAASEAFKKKYPFIDARVEELSGLENYTRMVHEMKAGLARGWDVNYLAFEHYNDYLPYQKKFDLLGMAQHGIIRISPRLVDPVNRHIVAVQSNIQVVAYNKELISEEKVPNSWEDFLRPEFKGRKFVVDVRPKTLAALVPTWGLEKVLDFSRRIAAQEPVWFRGDARVLTFMLAGDQRLFLGANYKTLKEVQRKDPRGVLGFKIAEPVPTRLTEAEGVLSTAGNPYAGLLWLEFVCSPEGQKLLDEVDLAASLFTPGSVHEQITRGKTISVMAWEHYTKMGHYEEQIVKAFGFPTAAP
jgi:iron(III) transport system substrate-binding protein